MNGYDFMSHTKYVYIMSNAIALWNISHKCADNEREMLSSNQLKMVSFEFDQKIIFPFQRLKMNYSNIRRKIRMQRTLFDL